MRIDWDEEDIKDYIKYYRRNHDLLHGFKLKWYQKLWVEFLYWLPFNKNNDWRR